MDSGWWDRLKQNVGLEAPPQEEPSLLQHLDEVSSLNRTQVIRWFIDST